MRRESRKTKTGLPKHISFLLSPRCVRLLQVLEHRAALLRTPRAANLQHVFVVLLVVDFLALPLGKLHADDSTTSANAVARLVYGGSQKFSGAGFADRCYRSSHVSAVTANLQLRAF